MTEIELLIWYGIAFIGLGGSALFSGLETGIYTVNRIRLHLLATERQRRAMVLDKLVERPNRVLGILLISNNMANYAASLAIGILLNDAGFLGWSQVMVSALILTPMLLIFGEVLPKDFFRSHTDRVTYWFARPLQWLGLALTITGLLPLIMLISWGLRKLMWADEQSIRFMHPRRVVTHLIKEGAGRGMISPYQSDISDRILQLDRVKVRDVVTAWKDVSYAKIGQPIEAFWSMADRVPYSRVPVVDQNNEVIGVADVNDVLRNEEGETLTRYSDEVTWLDEDVALHDALIEMQQNRVSIGFVRSNGDLRGIVTTKDLVEPMVGELGSW